MGLELSGQGDRPVATVDVTALLDRLSVVFWRVLRQAERAGIPTTAGVILTRATDSLDRWADECERMADRREQRDREEAEARHAVAPGRANRGVHQQ